MLRGYIPLIFSKINHFWLFDVFWYFKVWRISLSHLFLFFKYFSASIFHFKIEILERYSLATDIVTNFNCFKAQYYTRKSIFLSFFYGREPRKTPYK